MELQSVQSTREFLDFKDDKKKIKAEKDIKVVADDLSSDSCYTYSFDCGAVDIPLGGGFHSGRIHEIYGKEGAGKTSDALWMTKIFSDYWKAKGEENYVVLWVESESAFDKLRALYMGIPLEKFIIYETDVLEYGRDKIKATVERARAKGTKLMVVWDTIAATSPEKEKEDGANSQGMMLKPRLIKAMLREIVNDIGASNTTYLILNQVSVKIGQFTSGWDSTGGQGLRHFASIRTYITKVGEEHVIMPDGSKKIRAIIQEFKHEKNKMTTPKLKSVVVLDVENGIDKVETSYRFLKANKIVPAPAGSWTTFKVPEGYFKDGKPQKMMDVKFQGIPQLAKIIEEKHPHVYNWMEYLTYITWTAVSPLIKVKNIMKLWELETMFFGSKQTVLTDRERKVAEFVYKDLQVQADKEEKEQMAKEKEEIKKNMSKVKTKPKAKK